MTNLATNLLAHIGKAHKIAIITHVNPDGDGFCAALALQRIIARFGKDSVIYTDDDDLTRYAYLMQECHVEQYREGLVQDLDLMFILDCNSRDRLGIREELLKISRRNVLLDHHVVENNPILAETSLIDSSYVSVGAIIHAIFKDHVATMGIEDKLHIGNCLYTTVLNDTNNFANANTNKEVYLLCADLCEWGIKPNALYKEFFLNHAAEEMRYVGETLATIQLYLNNKVLIMHSTVDMMHRNRLNPDSVMNITRWVQGVKGIDAIAYLREDAPQLFKLSLRSIGLDVNKIAVRYGGGGHRQASGCTMQGSLEEVTTKILSDFAQALKEKGD